MITPSTSEGSGKRRLSEAQPDFDAVIVGAGFSGLYMLHRLREIGLSVRVFERGSGVGGTWYWNRYPGARCDTDSVEYSYQFSDALQQEWRWTERFATQPEILRYLEHVADRFDLRRDISFETSVAEAAFDEAAGCWRIATDDGARLSATYCIMATGCLSAVNRPAFEGLERFQGDWYHTGAWPHEEVSFAGQHVGIIGTGSSAIQSIPLIAAEARHLTVFQRQANYTIPARNAPLDATVYADVRSRYGELRRQAKHTSNGCWWSVNPAAAGEMSPSARRGELEARWEKGGLCMYNVFADVLVNDEANEIAAAFVREKIGELVHDPDVAALLSPHSFIGCKRICLDTDYYATFNRPNVTLVDISDAPIEEITRTGVRTGGEDYALDAIVLRHRVRRDDRAAAQDRHPRQRRADAPVEVGRRPAHLSRPRDRGLSQPLHDHRAEQSFGADQHGPHHRAARRVDRGPYRARARPRSSSCRSEPGGGGRVDRPSRRGRERDALPRLQLLVRRRQCRRQAAPGDALYRRVPRIHQQVRGGRRQRLRGILAERRVAGVRWAGYASPRRPAGGSQGSVPMSAGTEISIRSKASEVATSLCGMPPGM